MTSEFIGIQSMDAVSAGDWLVVNRGPATYKKGETSAQKAYFLPEYEGLLVNVLAVSPPVMLVRVFPFRDTLNNNLKTIVTAWHWDRQRFSRATEGYIETYLELGGYNRDGSRKRSRETVIPPVPMEPKKKKRVSRKVIIDGEIQTMEDKDE